MHQRTLFLAAIALLAGCRGGTIEHLARGGPSQLPTGWTAFEDPESGVSIGIPGGWAEGTGVAADSSMGSDPAANADPNSQAGQFARSIGQLSQAIEQQSDQKARERLRADGVVINVTDGSKTTIGEQRTRFYVKRVQHDSDYPFEYAVLDEKNHLLKPGAGEDVMLPVGKAHKFRTQNTLIDGDVQTAISYVMTDGHDSYVIRFISTNQPTVFDSFEKQVAESFRIEHK